MRKNRTILLCILCLLLLCATGCVFPLFGGEDPSLYDAELGIEVPWDELILLEEDELAVLFMNVGQADCILILQGEHSMLVDTATADMYDIIRMHLTEFGVGSLDALVLTHPHADHIGSASQIIAAFPIGDIFMPDAITTTLVFERTLDSILEKGIPTTVPQPGDRYTLGNADILFLSPPSTANYTDLNASSIVFLLEFQGIRMLFTGDTIKTMETGILEFVKDPDSLQCDVLKVPHHGSRTSSCEEFVAAVNPTWAVFTTTGNSSDGLPKEEIIARYEALGSACLFTHIDGSVLAKVINRELFVYTYGKN